MIPRMSQRIHTRRGFIALAGAGLGAAFVAACGDGDTVEPTPAPAAVLPTATPTPTPRVVLPTPTPTPRPIPPAGAEERLLLAGSEVETPMFASNSGLDGPRVMVLGGVHGNEPGGWIAAEEIATWEVTRGNLIVIPRANRLATEQLVRTTDELGDLNRLYPGRAEHTLPMGRMAHEIVQLVREFDVDVLFDLHESWGFFNEYDGGGTAFIGQTVTGSGRAGASAARGVVEAVNPQLTEREQLVLRSRGGGGFGFGFDGSFGGFGRGSSSLSISNYAPRASAVLIEMGQERQAVARRAEIHRLLIRAALEEGEMV
jgi:hypothetical protein